MDAADKSMPPAQCEHARMQESNNYIVEFDGPDDPMHPLNWPLKKKMPMALILGFISMTAAFGSSIFSTTINTVAQNYNVAREISVLGVSLYVLGFAFGPLLWAPGSELYGRKKPMLISSFGFSVFTLAVARAKDLQTILICRFFAGFFGACPITIVGAIYADMFDQMQRGLAISLFAITVFSGPLIAPFIGGFIDSSYLGWRWTQYITCIMGFTGLVLSLVFLRETYPPTILVSKAASLRRQTKNWGIHAEQEERETDFQELFKKHWTRPIRMLYSEPIVLALSVYMAFVYGLLYGLLSFYPVVFQKVHGFNPGVGGLPFLARS